MAIDETGDGIISEAARVNLLKGFPVDMVNPKLCTLDIRHKLQRLNPTQGSRHLAIWFIVSSLLAAGFGARRNGKPIDCQQANTVTYEIDS